MTVLSVIQDVCAVVGVKIPATAAAGNPDVRTMQEMFVLANEMAQRIAYDSGRDWQQLKAVATIPGDGAFVPPQPDPTAVWTGTSVFNLPADYKRMLLTSNVWTTLYSRTPMLFISDTDEWMTRRSRGDTAPYGEWTILGGQLHTWPIMAAGVSAYFAYMHKNCVRLNSGGFGDRFMSDADSFVLNERLLKLAMIWQWKAHKGSPYAEDLGTYGDALASEMGRDKPSPILVSGRRGTYDVILG